jgi:uncharacterized protein YcfJ
MNIFGILITGMLLVGQVFAQDHSAATPGLNQAGLNQEAAAHYGWADVLRVDPVYEANTQAIPSGECYEEQVIEPASVEFDNSKRTGATVLGAIIGGILGNRFGKGDGRKVATAAGVVAGGVVGNNLVVGQPGNAPKYTTRRRCPGDDAPNGPRRVVAYDVEYRYRGEIYTTRMSSDPGDRMRVRVTVTPAE